MSGHDPHAYDASVSYHAQVEEQTVVREASTPLPDDEAAKLCQLFAESLQSGLGYERIFSFMERQKFDKKVIGRLRYAVTERGDRLGEAFARIGLLDAPARKLILVAEEQGALPETFRQLGRVYEASYKRKKQVFYGLIEVFILCCLGGIVFPSVFVTGINASGNVQGSIFHALFIALLQSVVVLCFMGAVFYYWINLPVDSVIRRFTHNVWIRIPFLSEPTRLYAVATFCRYFRQSISSGIDIFRSLNLAAEASDSPMIWGRTAKAEAAIERGHPLDEALGTIPGLPDEVVEFIGIGEETGRLDEQLHHMEEKYAELSDQAFERTITATVYIVRMLLIVGIIGGALFLVTHSLKLPT